MIKALLQKINDYKHASEVGDRGISITKYKDDLIKKVMFYPP